MRRAHKRLHRLHAEQRVHDDLRVHGYLDMLVPRVVVYHPPGAFLFSGVLCNKAGAKRVCLRIQRMEAERFRKIDSKRGGRGFV